MTSSNKSLSRSLRAAYVIVHRQAYQRSRRVMQLLFKFLSRPPFGTRINFTTVHCFKATAPQAWMHILTGGLGSGPQARESGHQRHLGSFCWASAVGVSTRGRGGGPSFWHRAELGPRPQLGHLQLGNF